MSPPAPIRADASVVVGANWFGLIVLLGVLLGFCGGDYRNLPQAVMEGSLLTLLLALAVPAVLVSAVIQTARFWRFGTVDLALAAPPLPGRTLSGTVIVPRSLPAFEQATVTLTLEHVYAVTRNGTSTTEVNSLWRTETMVDGAAIRRLANRVEFPLAVAVPADLPTAHERGKLRWQLQLRVPMAGPDLVQGFELPFGNG